MKAVNKALKIFNMKNTRLIQLFNDFLSIIYPNLCLCCDKVMITGEKYICTTCIVGLPRTHYHLTKENPVEQLFWGRIPIEKATSFFTFQKGSRYQIIMHYLKYKGLRGIGVEMGRIFAAELNKTSYFNDIDFLVPVPLHPKKERKRGYNQSLAIVEGMAINIKGKIVSDNLHRKSHTESQTRKGRYERWENVSTLFGVYSPEEFNGKHILLIDDVVTTGSTLEACAQTLKNCKNTKVSIATLAFASI